jgi:hypothetical protein
MKRTPYSAHRSNELRKNKSGHVCSQRAQLVGVTLGRLRGQKLAEKIIFIGSSKKSGAIYGTIAVNSLTPICVPAGTKNYPSVDFLHRNSTFLRFVNTTQPTNNTTMVSFHPLPRHGFNTYTQSIANARWTSGWGRGWSKRFH